MLNKLKHLFEKKPAVDYFQLVQQGAIILDVRSRSEFAGGHIKGSINIPVSELSSQVRTLKDKSIPIITCCASGIRSASARSWLLHHGYVHVFNAGSWISLQHKLNLKTT